MKKCLLLGGMIIWCFLPLLLQAQVAREIPPVTQTFVLTNATIITQPGKTMDKGQILIKDGLISAIGTNVRIPSNAKVVNADSMFVYAGFIEGLSYTGIPQPREEGSQRGQGPPQRGEPVKDPGNPTNEEAGIQPDRSVVSMLNAGDGSIETMRKLGFTAAHVVPRGNLLPGTGAVILLAGDDAGDLVIAENTSLFSNLDGARRVYPATLMAVMSKWRELYKQAMQAKAHEKNYETNPRGMTRPEYDAALSAFYPVLDKKLPVFFTAESVKDAYRVMTLQEELGFPLVMAELKQGFYMTDALKQKNFPLLLSLDIPESIKEEKKSEKKEGEEPKAKMVKDEKADPEKEALEKRRKEAIEKHQSQAATLDKAGINFGFSTLSVKSKDLKTNLLTMIEKGLSEEKALAALTTVPAKMLGLSEMMGTVEQGKIANLVVTDKPYFDKESNVRYVFVDGKMFEYEAKKARKKGDESATVAADGDWSYAIDIPGQAMSGTFSIKSDGGTLKGTMTNPQDGSVGDLENVSLNGNNLSFSIPYDAGGQAMRVSFNLYLDKDAFEGSVTAGSFGTFDVEGSRISTPD
jgi:hypothetical protein